MIIFLIIVLTIYFSVNLFLFYQTKPLFELSGFGLWIKIFLLVLILAYPIGRTLEATWRTEFAVVLTKIGSIWLAFMLYLTLLFIVLSLVLLAAKLSGALTSQFRMFSVLIVYAVASLIIVSGYFNAINPRVNKISIKVDKPIPGNKLRIAMVSDIHLGTIIGKKELAKLVEMLNSQDADFVFLVGDVFDEDVAPVVNGQMGVLFQEIKSRYGVYAVTGNHEFFSNHKDKIDYLQNHGVNMLLDSVANIAGINIIGRYDRQSYFALKQNRKPLQELMQEVNHGQLTILLDHQPMNLAEASECNVDIQLSGHTHHGQMWPLNLATRAIFEVSMGYKKKENTHIYVSPGFGTWGPRVRLGNRPEIAVIDVIGSENVKL